MRIRYTPEGAQPKEWEFDPDRLMSPEAEAIETRTGLSLPEFVRAFGRGSMTAIHAFLWVMLKRQTPTLKYDEVQFCLAEIDIVQDDEEQRVALKVLSEKTDRTPDEDLALAQLIAQGVTPPDLAPAPADVDEAGPGEEPGKA